MYIDGDRNNKGIENVAPSNGGHIFSKSSQCIDVVISCVCHYVRVMM